MPWCPDSRGFGPACPSPTDPPDATYCCTVAWNGINRPSCCTFPVYTGVVIVLPIAAVALFVLLIFLTCHCWPDSPMNHRKARLRGARREVRKERRTEKGVEMELHRYDREPCR
ncbi:hypothetical protein PRIPAC_71842 [Pristionchus pacificus]|uniref:Uncharacterized protein n=1 Tax=Pristionchus pacificus TaxID=54126 RepID=A0A2A6BG11_PRIPA|nr:hypothetical protein PRIPAC_71842 [Pristionchus pacificus]|eukprot:PDM64855.1 hypothetical protein PRIPAC_53111 [Pristionchus pacificus]